MNYRYFLNISILSALSFIITGCLEQNVTFEESSSLNAIKTSMTPVELPESPDTSPSAPVDIPPELDPNDPDYQARIPIEDQIPEVNEQEAPVTNDPIVETQPIDIENGIEDGSAINIPETEVENGLPAPENENQIEEDESIKAVVDSDVESSGGYRSSFDCRLKMEQMEQSFPVNSKVIELKNLNQNEVFVEPAFSVRLANINSKNIAVMYSDVGFDANHINGQNLIVRAGEVKRMNHINTKQTCLSANQISGQLKDFNTGSLSIFGSRFYEELSFVQKVHKVNGGFSSFGFYIGSLSRVNGGVFLENSVVERAHQINGTIVLINSSIRTLDKGNGKIILIGNSEVKNLKNFNGKIEHR